MVKRFFKLILTVLLITLAVAGCVLAYFPIKYYDITRRYAAEYGLDAAMVYAVMHAESKMRVNASSSAGAKGLMQLTKQTADWAAVKIGIEGYSFDRVTEPDISIRIGCWYLRWLSDVYGDADTAIAAYNAGSGRVSQWLGDERYSDDGRTLTDIPFRETADYVGRVKLNYRIYGFLLKFY